MTTLTLDLADVMQAINKLPSLPAVVLELITSMEDEDVDIDTLARKISLDQALSAKTLRLANSSFYGVQRQITSARDAIPVLGFRTLHNVAVTAALAGALGDGGAPSFSFVSFWRHSIGTALCAKALAPQLGLNTETAYTAGLIHDIGRLVLATRFAPAYAQVNALRVRDDCYPLQAERALLGLDHAGVGAALAQHWKFPLAIQRATGEHHASDMLHAEPLTAAIHVADALAHALDFSTDDGDLVPQVRDATLRAIGMDQAKLIAVCQAAEKNFDAACSVLAR